MPWQHVSISRFGGPEVLELAEETTIPDPGPGEVRIKVLAAGTGFTDSFIRRGRYPDFKGPLPFTPGYEIVGIVEKTGPGVAAPRPARPSWSPISASSAATLNTRFAPPIGLFASRRASTPPRRSVFRSPISPPTR